MKSKTLTALVAGMMLAMSLGASAERTGKWATSVWQWPDEIENGEYYYITSMLGYGSLFVSGDSLALTSNEKTLPAYRRDYGLWKMAWTTNANGSKTYSFTNKATGQPLTLPTSGKALAYGGSLTSFAWGGDGHEAGHPSQIFCVNEKATYSAYTLVPVYYVAEDITIEGNDGSTTELLAKRTLRSNIDSILAKTYVQLQVVPVIYDWTGARKKYDWEKVGTYFDTKTYDDDYGYWYIFKYSAENTEYVSTMGGISAYKTQAEAIFKKMQTLRPDLNYFDLERKIAALQGSDVATELSDVVKAVDALGVMSSYIEAGASAPKMAGTDQVAENTGLVYLPNADMPIAWRGKTVLKKGTALIIGEEIEGKDMVECSPILFSACIYGDMKMMADSTTTEGVNAAIQIDEFSTDGKENGVKDDADKSGAFFAKNFLKEFQTGNEGDDLSKVSTTIGFPEMENFETVLGGKNIQIVMRNLLLSESNGLGVVSGKTEQNLTNYAKATMIYDGEGKYLVVDTLTYEEDNAKSIHYKLAWASLDSVAKSSMDGGEASSGWTVADTTGTAAKFWKPVRGENGGYHAAAYVWDITYNAETSGFIIKPAYNVRKGSAEYFSADTVGSADGLGGKLLIEKNTSLVVSPYTFSTSSVLTLIEGTEPTSPMVAGTTLGEAKEYKVTRPVSDVYYIQYLSAGAGRDSSEMFVTAAPSLKKDHTGFEYMPETQWVLITDSTTRLSSILNRATGSALSFHGKSYNSVQLFDATSSTLKSDDALYVSLMGGDTLKLTSLPSSVKMDSLVGYKGYVKDVTEHSKYKLTYYNNLNATKEVALTADSILAVSTDGEGVWFRLDTVAFGAYGAPAIEGVSKRLYKTAYRLKAVIDGEERYVVEHDGVYEATGKEAADAATFDLKTELYAEGKLWYVLYTNYDAANTSYTNKASVDDSSLKLFMESTGEMRTSMFALTELPAPEYRRLGKTVEDGINDMDTAYVEIFKANEPTRYLFENTLNVVADNGTGVRADSLNYLGIYNKSDFERNASIFVDTAYVRGETHKPLYMLAMGVTYTPGSTVGSVCPIHGAGCEHTTATTTRSKATGRYLVALPTDSTDHNASAMYQGKARLAFVSATHVGDSLVIARSMYTGVKDKAANDTLTIGETMNAATFAFKMADGGEGDFVIEAVGGQFVRIHNGVPVLVDDETRAAVFNLKKTDVTPTANEEIAAGGIKVIAGEGFVTVKGAAGKRVVVSNILGQTVANTTVSSDEARITAPRGVVVVAVEGLAAQKVIVR